MSKIPEQYQSILTGLGIKVRTLKKLNDYNDNLLKLKKPELIPFYDKKRNGVALMLGLQVDNYQLVYFEQGASLIDSKTGRSKPAICDLCWTWHAGVAIRYITFSKSPRHRGITKIVCSDIVCSLSVRYLGLDSEQSKINLPESTQEIERLARLNTNLAKLINSDLPKVRLE